MQAEIANENLKVKKGKDQQYLEEIKLRNQELVLKQKERGTTGESLKQKEERLEEEGRREEMRLDRDRKR